MTDETGSRSLDTGTDELLARVEEEVAILTMNRPRRRNALTSAMVGALRETLLQVERDPDVRCIVLTGAGGTFCSGADLKAVADGQGNRVAVDGDGPMGPTRLELSKPVIAAVEGHAVAGGLELAIWCDLRVAARDAVFGVYCRRFGVPLIDGGTVRLPRLIGHGHALDMILTGRGVSGEEAMRMGLANRVVEPGAALDEAMALAERIAEFPQGCMRADRRSSYRQFDLDLATALRQETRDGLEVIASGETVAGARRFSDGEGRGGAGT